MKDGHGDGGDDDHGAFKDHEGGLILGQLAVESGTQLGHSEDGTNEDGEGGHGQRYRWDDVRHHRRRNGESRKVRREIGPTNQEQLPQARASQRCVCGHPGGLVTISLEGEVGA